MPCVGEGGQVVGLGAVGQDARRGSRGCRVLTRPPSISGKPVTSATSRCAMPASRSAAAVPPEATSSTPSAASPRANSTRPVLSHTLSSALIYASSSVPATDDGLASLARAPPSPYRPPRVELALDRLDALVQRRLVVAGARPRTRRWARIGPSSSATVATCTVQPVSVTPRRERLGDRVPALEGRQQARVGVEHATREGVVERAGDDRCRSRPSRRGRRRARRSASARSSV